MLEYGGSEIPTGDNNARRLVAYARGQAEPTLQARLASNPRELPADLFPGYTIVAKVGGGGQGRVYEAIDNSTQRRVAIKVLRSDPFGDEAVRGRFEREIQILAQLQHPNIVTIHSSGTVALQRYFVMDFIEGQPLDGYLADNHLSIEKTLAVFLRICDAVNAAHLSGIVHRDLKPGNIRIDDHGEPHVLDFGLAKTVPGHAGGAPSSMDATIAGQFVGSLPWAAPEQVMNVPTAIDLRTDVYGLGLVLYFMLTRSLPYKRGVNLRDMTDSILRSDPAPPSTLRPGVDDELSTIVLMCLQKEPDRRYQIAGELARDIRRYRAGQPIEAKRDHTGYLLAKTLRRHRGLAMLAAAFVVISVGYATTISLLYQRATKSEQLANERADDVSKQYATTQEAIGFLVGEVSNKLNHTAGNARVRRDILQGAFDRLLPLIERHGDDPLLLEDLMRVHYQLGDIAIALNHYDTASTHLEKAMELRLALTPAETMTPKSRSELSIHYVLLGDVARKRGDITTCENLYRRSLAIDEQLATDHPDDSHFADNLAWSFDRLGALAVSKGDALGAEVLYRKQLAVMQRLVEASPKNATHLEGLAAAHARLGQCAMRRGDQHASAQHFAQGVAAGRLLLDAGSENPPYWYTYITRVCSYYCALQMAQSDVDTLDSVLEARDMAGHLIDLDPQVPRNRRALMLTDFYIMNAPSARRTPGLLEEHVRDFLSAKDAYLAIAPLTPEAVGMNSCAHRLLAKALRDQGREADAADVYREAVASIEAAFEVGVDSPQLRIQLAEWLQNDTNASVAERIAAIDDARRSIASAADRVPAHIAGVGRLYQAAGMITAAIEMLEQAEIAYKQLGADLPEADARTLRACRTALDE